MDIYSQAKQELSEIDSKISALHQRRETLCAFLDLGSALYPAGTPNPGRSESPTEAVRAWRVTHSVSAGAARSPLRVQDNDRFASSNKARILAVCEEHLQLGAARTRDLLAAVEEAGLEVGGTDKVGALSVMLSKAERFKADRKIGWTLVSTHKEVTPQGEATPEGSDLWNSQPEPEEAPTTAPGPAQ